MPEPTAAIPPTAVGPTPRVFPAIDLRGGNVVRLLQGDYDRQTTYGDDPVSQARLFSDAGAQWLHVVDLDGARSGEATHRDVIAAIARAVPMKLEVGGGVRDQATIDALLEAGVHRVVVGTAALRDWPWFETLAWQDTYAGRLVLGLDARDGHVATDGWEQTSDLTAVELARRVNGWPLAAIVYTDIATDGTLRGPNVSATAEMCGATDVPIVASGGVGSLEHLAALKPLPIQGAIVGRALYDGKFTLAEAIATFEG
ncbi:MAG: 1-(5-phosphoribosyl)-5-[(5-phosphoribosylamino)methylideneamino]imidazole-4-carboxamide isomerase [Planctomycetota bacterium]